MAQVATAAGGNLAAQSEEEGTLCTLTKSSSKWFEALRISDAGDRRLSPEMRLVGTLAG